MSANGALFIDDIPQGYSDPQTGRLLLAPILDGLLTDGLILAENHQILTSVRTSAGDAEKNALQVIADSGWDNQLQVGQKLTINVLMEWLSKKIDVPVKKIDPLNTDVQSVTAVMSLAYAKRFQIIALEVTPTVVVIGTAEPFDQRWELELAKVLQKNIVRVLVSTDDINRYLHEFYTVSKSVLSAKKEQNAQVPASGVQNLEQMMELQMISTWLTLLTGCCSMRLNSAPVIFILSLHVKTARCVFVSTVCCIRYTKYHLQ